MKDTTKDKEAMFKPSLELLGELALKAAGFHIEMDGMTKAQLYLLCSVVVVPTARHWGFILLGRLAQLVKNRARQ